MDYSKRPSRETVAFKEFEPLPIGGYVMKILLAEVKENANGYKWIEIQHDVAEGEYAGYYQNQYKNSTLDNVKFKGKHIIGIPQEGHQYYDSQFNNFWRHIYAIEDSNIGFVFDIEDLNKLIDKKVGAVFFEKEWEFDNKKGFSVQCHHYEEIVKIKEGNFKQPETKYLNNKNNGWTLAHKGNSQVDGNGYVSIDGDDIPF